MNRRTRLIGGIAAVLFVLVGVAGCGDDDDEPSAGDSSTTTTESSVPVIIDIVEDNGEVTPNDAKVVEVGVGQEVQLNVTSDADDELHLHSDPEQSFEVKAGEDQKFTFSIDSPGTYDLESHGLEVTIVKFQVS